MLGGWSFCQHKTLGRAQAFCLHLETTWRKRKIPEGKG